MFIEDNEHYMGIHLLELPAAFYILSLT